MVIIQMMLLDARLASEESIAITLCYTLVRALCKLVRIPRFVLVEMHINLLAVMEIIYSLVNAKLVIQVNTA